MNTQQCAPEFALTWHAVDQMDARSLSIDAITHALTYGRHVWTRGARVFAIGRREVEQYRAMGVNLNPYEGVQVVTAADGTILTVYRNRDLRGLRHKRPRSKHCARTIWSAADFV